MTDTLDGVTPNASTQAAMATGTASGSQLGPLASELATRIALGQMAAPTDSAGWKSLVEQYTGGGISHTSADQVPAFTDTTTTTTTQNDTQPATTTDASSVDKFLTALRQHESGGDYQAYNAAGGASGAYQYIQSTWSSYAKAAGFAQYANGPASAAPPQVQDAVAKYNALQLFNQSGSWKTAAESWYYPAWANDPSKQNSVPYPSAGNTETIGAYGNQIVSMMGQGIGPQAKSSPNAPAFGSGAGGGIAVNFARTQLGVPYAWGGEQTGVDFDCSGLVQAAFRQEGVDLPRTAQAQYDSTTHLAPGQQPQAGDLVFYGHGPQNVEHVGIYIGNGEMIDAPHTGAAVRVEKLWGGEVGFTRPTSTTAETPRVGVSSPNVLHDYYMTLQQVNSAMREIQ